LSTPSAEQPRNTTQQQEKPVAATGNGSSQPSSDRDSAAAPKNTDNTAPSAVSTIAGREKKPAGEISTPPSPPVEKVEVKVDKASS
jgi:hypothetical protein